MNETIVERFAEGILFSLKSSIESERMINPQICSASVEFKLIDKLQQLGASHVNLELNRVNDSVVLSADVIVDENHFHMTFNSREQIRVFNEDMIDNIQIDEAICIATIIDDGESTNYTCRWDRILSIGREMTLYDFSSNENEGTLSRTLEDAYQEEVKHVKAENKIETRRAYSVLFLLFSSIFLFGTIIHEGHFPPLLGILILVGDVWSLHNLGVF